MKSPKPAERPKAVEALAAITEIALQFRTGPDQAPTLNEIARITGQASRLLRIQDIDEKISVENAATVQLAKKHSLMSS
jgi:hypothetical protein